MKTIKGSDDYLIFTDEEGQVYDGILLDENSSIVTNLEDVTTDKIEVLSVDEAANL